LHDERGVAVGRWLRGSRALARLDRVIAAV